MNRSERRSYLFGQAILAKLKADPSLLQIGRDNLARYMKQPGAVRSMPYFEAWKDALDAGLEGVTPLLEGTSSHASTMRSCSPFAGVLTNQERWGVIRRLREERN